MTDMEKQVLRRQIAHRACGELDALLELWWHPDEGYEEMLKGIEEFKTWLWDESPIA